jgi:hypothetical protein
MEFMNEEELISKVDLEANGHKIRNLYTSFQTT